MKNGIVMCVERFHAENGCSVCEKTFKYQEIKSKHMRIAYAIFSNNKKTCPYSKDCIFLHQDFRICNCGKKRERMHCMFKHEEDEVENNDTLTVINIEKVVEENESDNASNGNSGDINEENDDQETVKIDDPNDNSEVIETVAIVETVRYDDISIIEKFHH